MIFERFKEIKLPKIGAQVDVPVYVIHVEPDAEAYFFIFDFEVFVERSQAGLFVRPRLIVWAGRSDFSRPRFARQFREAFAEQFDAARAALTAEQAAPKGWFGWLREQASGGFQDLLANLVLALALGVGHGLLAQIGKGHILRGKSETEKLEDAILDTQTKVDGALADMEIKLHIDLYHHAWRGQTPGPMTGMDPTAWPLPSNVAQHLLGGP